MMMRYQHDYYKILGLSKSANSADIKHAYRKLATAHHPDRTDDDGQMTLINEAYAVLKDPKKRADYDAFYVVQYSRAGQLAQKVAHELSKSPTVMTNLKKAERQAHVLAHFAQHQFDKIMPTLQKRAKILANKLSDLMDKPTLPITPQLACDGGQVVFDYHGRAVRTTLPQGLTDGSQIKLMIDGVAVWFVIKITL